MSIAVKTVGLWEGKVVTEEGGCGEDLGAGWTIQGLARQYSLFHVCFVLNLFFFKLPYFWGHVVLELFEGDFVIFDHPVEGLLVHLKAVYLT